MCIRDRSLIGLTIYSIGGIFFGTGVPLRNDGLAMTVALLAYLTPGYSRTIPGVHRFLRACEWAVMGCSLVCTAAVIIGDVTSGGIDPEPYNMPWNVSMIAAFAALCFFVVLIICLLYTSGLPSLWAASSALTAAATR